MMRRRWSVRAYLWLLLLAVAVPCASVLIYSLSADAQYGRAQAEATAMSLAQLVAGHISEFLGEAEQLAATLAQRPAIRAVDANRRDPVFDQFLALHPQ